MLDGVKYFEHSPPGNRPYAVLASRQVLLGFHQSGLNSDEKDGDCSGKSARERSPIAEQQSRCARLTGRDQLRPRKWVVVFASVKLIVPASASL